jgi:hypothetical protein
MSWLALYLGGAYFTSILLGWVVARHPNDSRPPLDPNDAMAMTLLVSLAWPLVWTFFGFALVFVTVQVLFKELREKDS